MIAKFQAWDMQENEWFPNTFGGWININSSGEIIYGFEDQICEPNEGRFEIRWFIGKCDKNGKEIYQGDVVEWDTSYKDNGQMETCRQVVAFDEKDQMKITPWINSTTRVIGNIYENPELKENLR